LGSNFDLGRKSKQIQKSFYSFKVRDKEIKIQTHTESLSHSQIPKVALPNTKLGAIF
jgi:methylmalonyl-CoA mutase